MFNLYETAVSSHHTFSNNVRAALNVINSSDDLLFHYVTMEGLAVATLATIGVVAYVS